MSALINNPNVVFEHSLREYVRKANAVWDKLFADEPSPPRLNIRYMHDSGDAEGQWEVGTYHRGTSANTVGAILQDVVQEHATRHFRTAALRVLPTLIAPPTRDEEVEAMLSNDN